MTQSLQLPQSAPREVEQGSFREWSETGRVYYGDGLTEGIDFLYDEIFHKSAYQQHGIEFREGQTIFDVGAHVGLFTLYAITKCKGNASLYCFEPIPPTFSFLHKNLKSHGLLDKGNGNVNVKLFNMGLAQTGSPGEADFVHYHDASVLSTMKPTESQDTFDKWASFLNPRHAFTWFRRRWPKTFPFYFALYLLLSPFFRRTWRKKLECAKESETFHCRLSTVSEICREHHVESIDLLKIDVEGAELDVLNGIEEHDWPKVQQLVMEVNNVGGRLAAIEQKLAEQRFDVVVERPDWSELSQFDIYFVYARRK